MDAITAEHINSPSTGRSPDTQFHPVSIAYVQFLLKPYAEAIEPAQDIESIKQWLSITFPEEVATVINRRIEKSISVKEAKMTVINYFLNKVARDASTIAYNINTGVYDHFILPWDVQSVAEDYDAEHIEEGENSILAIYKIDDGLPVSVIVNEQVNNFLLKQDFVAGLLLFSSLHNIDFNVIMFGVYFSPNYMKNDIIRYRTMPFGYHIDIGGETYKFLHPEFMQGFITGANWAGVDHRTLWKNLTGLDERGKRIPLDF